MSRFVAFDVETPNRLSNRMSAIGITVIENGEITDEFYSLVNPETHFDYFNVQLTGINAETVRNAPAFPSVWTQIEPMISSGLLVAHNAVYDMSVLKKCLSDYGIEWKPYVRYLCTVQMDRRVLPGISHKLNVLCDYYEINLDHHQAASDSRACAKILLRYLKVGADIRQHIKTYSLSSCSSVLLFYPRFKDSRKFKKIGKSFPFQNLTQSLSGIKLRLVVHKLRKMK